MLEQESLDFEQGQHPIREFLGWDAPLLKSVTNWLFDEKRLDYLASTLLVVPTTNSGRRLRHALSDHGGFFSPRVVVPSQLFEVDGVASRQESLWAWVKVIQQLDVEDYPHLLPNHQSGSTASFGVAMALAKQLMTLRELLAEGDASFHNARYHSPEPERWDEMGRLENEMLQCLGRWGLRDSVLVKREQVKTPTLPTGVTHVVVACVPDPTLLALRALQSLVASGIQVTVLIHAPESESNAFDVWGIPDTAAWTQRNINFPDWRQRMHVVDGAVEAAGCCVRMLAENGTSSDTAAIGLCDSSFAHVIEQSFEEAGWKLYNPEGRGLADTGLVSILRAMRHLTGQENRFDALCELIRLPGAELLLPEKTSRHWAARQLDRLHLDHLPETVADAMVLADQEEKKILQSVTSKLDELGNGNLAKTLRDWLIFWLGHTDSNVAAAAEQDFVDSLEAIERLQGHRETPSPQEAFEMLAESLSSVRVAVERGDTVVDLQGWLELSYDPAPHLILAGMHEECVPEGGNDDLFVPDSLRRHLGLRDAQGRFARDAFLLQAAVASRANDGRVDAVVARFNDAGEARKPSRLLMRQSGSKLAAIVAHLFEESKSSHAIGGAWQRDWMLKMPEFDNPYLSREGEPLRRLSPSAIKDYLNCPLRFYLRRIVGMDAYESGKREMNALDFGNLCHAVLEAFGNDVGLRESTDAEEITAGLFGMLDRLVEKTYGQQISLPLMVQVESARERLRAFAGAQAVDRTKGWTIVETEFLVGGEDANWHVAGHPFGMMIDRIDRHEDGKQWRVWDYKTSGKAKRPEDQHLIPWRENENRPLLGKLYAPKRKNASERRWAEVQLPLYAAFVQQHFKTGELPRVGYINLPRAVSDVGFVPWERFDQAALDHAMIWVEAAIDKIRASEFDQAAVYPVQEREWDDFDELAPDGLASAFDL